MGLIPTVYTRTKRHNRRDVAFISILLFGCTVAVAVWWGGCVSTTGYKQAGRVVKIAMLAEVGEGVGEVDGPERGRLRSQRVFVRDPTEVVVVLPHHVEVSTVSKMTIINTVAGNVVDVSLLPMMQTGEFREAVAEMHRLLDGWGIKPDEEMANQISRWPENVPGAEVALHPRVQFAVMDLTPDIRLDVRIRPSFERGWFLAVTISANQEARWGLLPSDERIPRYRD